MTGTATFAGALSGNGTLALAGATTSFNAGATIGVSNWTISGAAAVAVNEYLIYRGAFSLGSGSTIAIGAGDELQLAGAAALSGSVTGPGTLRISGSASLDAGVAVGAGVINTGTIAVSAGTVDLQKSIHGAGTLAVSGGATLQLDDGVAATQTVAFSGPGALKLTSAGNFSAAISGFGAGDTLDLAAFGFHAGAGETLGFVENGANTQGVLTVTDGSLHASIILLGQYSAAGFHKNSDGASGTAITYTPPVSASAAIQLAAGH